MFSGLGARVHDDIIDDVIMHSCWSYSVLANICNYLLWEIGYWHSIVGVYLCKWSYIAMYKWSQCYGTPT